VLPIVSQEADCCVVLVRRVATIMVTTAIFLGSLLAIFSIHDSCNIYIKA
jgi:hypothetical protein